jgi:hypothetical protein
MMRQGRYRFLPGEPGLIYLIADDRFEIECRRTMATGVRVSFTVVFSRR